MQLSTKTCIRSYTSPFFFSACQWINTAFPITIYVSMAVNIVYSFNAPKIEQKQQTYFFKYLKCFFYPAT